MSYAVNNLKDIVQRDMFVRLSARIRISSWTLLSGNVYYASFPFGPVVFVNHNGSAMTEGTSTSLSANNYYYDSDAQVLYVRKSDSTAPTSTDWIVPIFYVYASTYETVWYSDPTDDTTDMVLWRGIITQPPVVSRSSDQLIFGYSPVQDTTMTCKYDAEYLQQMMYDVTFNKNELVIYHRAGSLDTANFTKIFTGLGGTHSHDDESFQINITDKTYKFERLWNNGSSSDVYPSQSTINGSGTDPDMQGLPIPMQYGSVNIRMVNRAYEIDSPTTSDNRDWTAYTAEYGSTPAAPGYAYLIQNGTKYSLTNVTHYTIGNLGDTENTFGISLKTTCEAGVGASTVNGQTDYIVSSFYAPAISVTINGSSYSLNTSNPRSLLVLYHILSAKLGLTTSDINDVSFEDNYAASNQCRLRIPEVGSTSFPTFKDVITRLLATALCRAYFDGDGKFTVKPIAAAAGTADLALTDDDLIDPKFSYDMNDIYRVTVKNTFDYPIQLSGSKSHASAYPSTDEAVCEQVTDSYEAKTYVHNEVRDVEIQTYYYTTPTTLATQLSELLGERRGFLSFFTKNGGAYDLELGDTVSITRTKLPGYAYDGTEQTRSFVVNEIRKQIDGVYLVLDDQKAIEENSGDW